MSKPHQKPCAFCGEPFFPQDGQQRYCSTKCGYACPERNKRVSRNRAAAARTTIARKWAKDIKEAGFWSTPELLALLQKVDLRGYQRGVHSKPKARAA